MGESVGNRCQELGGDSREMSVTKLSRFLGEKFGKPTWIYVYGSEFSCYSPHTHLMKVSHFSI